MKPIRVMVVDDSKVFMDALISCLAQWEGVEITGRAASGAEALGLIDGNKPDLVLMDVFMPVMNGLEASKRIERSAGLPKIVLMTSLDDAGAQKYVLDGMADAFIFKSDICVELERHMQAWFPPFAHRAAN